MFGYFIVLPAALRLPARLRQQHLHRQPPGPGFLTFCTHVLFAMAIVWELPLFVVGPHPARDPQDRQLRKNRRLWYFIVACLAVALPGVDPVTVTLEVLPLMILFEPSIWLSVLLDRRSARLRTAVQT